MTTTNDWRKKLPFLEASEGIKKSVMGKDMMFYPISSGKIFKLRKLAGPIGKLLDTLQKNSNVISQKISRMAATETEGEVDTTEIFAIDPRLEEQMALRRQFAISELIEALTDDKNIEAVGNLILDSIKDVFPRDAVDNPSGAEFIETLPLPALGDMVMGVVDSNKEVFGPLAGKIKEEIQSRMMTLTPEPEAETVPEVVEEPSPSPTPPMDPATLGSISPTASNGSQPEAIVSNGS